MKALDCRQNERIFATYCPVSENCEAKVKMKLTTFIELSHRIIKQTCSEKYTTKVKQETYESEY